MVGGVLYVSTSLSQVAAIDAATGKTRWVYDPETWKGGTPSNNGFVHRGVASFFTSFAGYLCPANTDGTGVMATTFANLFGVEQADIDHVNQGSCPGDSEELSREMTAIA